MNQSPITESENLESTYYLDLGNGTRFEIVVGLFDFSIRKLAEGDDPADTQIAVKPNSSSEIVIR